MSRTHRWVVLGTGAIVFVVFHGFLSMGLPVKFPSPDESANHLFTQSFATRGSLALPSPLTAADGIVAPRSMLTRAGELLPASFLGMPLLYGAIARVIGMWAVPFLTPLITYVALLALYGLFARLFPKRIALVSTVLVALHPAVWYATTRGMFHNMLFVDCCIIGAYALVRGFETASLRSKLWLGLSGLSIGSAIAVRSSEVLWVSAVLLVVVFIVRKKSAFHRGWWAFVACGLIPVVIILTANQHLYGHALSFGYSGGVSSADTIAGLSSTIADKISGAFFPFGFHPVRAFFHFVDYSIRLFWFPTLISIVGLVGMLRIKGITRPQKWFYLGTAAVSVWLILYYGSWTVQDSPDPGAVTVGTSYARYWLPLYILTMPLAATLLVRVRELAPRAGRIVMVLSLLAVWSTGALTVVFNPLEGTVALRKQIVSYGSLGERAQALTPSDAVIISSRGDKVFFPERSVIMSVETSAQQKQLRELMVKVPVYVYVPAADSPVTVSRMWISRGFSLTTELPLAPYERLYLLRDGIDDNLAQEVQ